MQTCTGADNGSERKLGDVLASGSDNVTSDARGILPGRAMAGTVCVKFRFELVPWAREKPPIFRIQIDGKMQIHSILESRTARRPLTQQPRGFKRLTGICEKCCDQLSCKLLSGRWQSLFNCVPGGCLSYCVPCAGTCCEHTHDTCRFNPDGCRTRHPLPWRPSERPRQKPKRSREIPRQGASTMMRYVHRRTIRPRYMHAPNKECAVLALGVQRHSQFWSSLQCALAVTLEVMAGVWPVMPFLAVLSLPKPVNELAAGAISWTS